MVKSISTKIAIIYTLGIILIALIAPFLAKEGGIIPYSQYTIDIENSGFQSPSSKHYLGTDLVGRDVLAMYLHGSIHSVKVGFFSTLLALLIGLLIGFLSGYFGNKSVKSNYYQITFFTLGIIYFTLVLSYYGSFILFGIALGWLLIILLLGRLKNTIYLPLDTISQLLMQLLSSTPKLFVILFLSFLFTPSVMFLIICLGIILSVQIAFITRSEIIKIKTNEFVIAAESLGIGSFGVFKNHILPNILPNISVVIINVAIVAIVAEAGFSYLGIGISAEDVSWGKMLSEARNNLYAWWIWIPPFVSLVGLLASLNSFINKKNS